jgi:hypothetical protein
MKGPFTVLLYISFMIHVKLCAGRYHVPGMPGLLSEQDWSRNAGYNCYNCGAQSQQFSSYPYSSTPYHHDFEYQHNICCPGNTGTSAWLDHAYGKSPWPETPTTRPLWSWPYENDPYGHHQCHSYPMSPGNLFSRPGHDTGCFGNGWCDYGACNDKVHMATTNCRVEEKENCRKQMATLEQKLREQCTKAIEKTCNNRFPQPEYGGACKENCNKEKASLQERHEAQCATALLNAATKCKSDQDTIRDEHRQSNKLLKQENERLEKQNGEYAQKAKDNQKANEKLELDNKDLEQQIENLKKTHDEHVQMTKDDQKAKQKLEKANEELEQENKKLKKQNDEHVQLAKEDQKAKDELEQENDRLKKQAEKNAQKTKDDQKAKDELEQENDRLKKQAEKNAQKTKDDQKAKDELKQENDKLKAESRPEKQPNKVASQLDSSNSELAAFSKKSCPSLHGERATVFGVTYEAFCGARPRGRYIDDYIMTRNFADCMAACTIDRGCQGVHYETSLARCRTTMDWDYPPRRWADNLEFSLVPVAPREGGIGATTPDVPSILIRDDYKDKAGCPNSDGTVVSVGSLQFRVHCRVYQPKKRIEGLGSSLRLSGMLGICALNPECQGIAFWANERYMFGQHEKLPEKTDNSDLVKEWEWVVMLTEPRAAA